MSGPVDSAGRQASEVLRGRRLWLTAVIVALAIYVAQSFLSAAILAAVFAVSTWPFYRAACERIPDRPKLVAGLFVAATALLVLFPLSMAASAMVQESQTALAWVTRAQHSGVPAPAWLGQVPLIGDRALAFWQSHVGSPQATARWLGGLNAGAVFGYSRSIGGQVLHASVLFAVVLLALFGMLVHGGNLANDFRRAMRELFGDFGLRFADHLATTVRGTVAGTVLVAVGEGLLIGLGYWVAGVPQALLFTILTMFVALLPFGAWLAFGLASMILLIAGKLLAAVLLLAWGAGVMLVGDNVVQPAIIGSAVRLPFLLALLGAFGGLEAFGLVGLFLGPVIMAALLLVLEELRAEPSHT